MPTDIASDVLRQFNPIKIGIEEFAESDSYCGKPLFPLQRVILKLIFLEEMTGQEEDLLTWMMNGGRGGEVQMSPSVRERREYCIERGYPHISEIDLVGGRRSGKGHITGIAGAKKLYDVVQIADPGAYYKMDPDKQIFFACIAASIKQAKERQFADLYSTITRCPPLVSRIPAGKALEESISIRTDADERNIDRMKKMGLKTIKDFSKLMVQPLAANASTVRGTAMIFLCMDEIAHMLPGESRSSAQEVYSAIEPSLSQFGYNALVFLNSSPYTKVGLFYDQTQLSMRPSDHPEGWFPMRLCIQFPSWGLYDQWWRDPRKRFTRSIEISPDWGDQLDAAEPESKLDHHSLEERQMQRLREKSNPEMFRVEYRAQWAEVIDSYLDSARVDLAFNGLLPDGRKCKRTIDGGYEYDFIAHCDPSSTTAGFGYSIAHVEEFDDPTGLFPGGKSRHVVFDQVRRWNPKDFPGETINYIQVRKELEHDLLVYRPSELSFDQFQSTGLQQELREFCRGRGLSSRINIDTATANLNWRRWETFKTALYLGLVHVPPDCVNPRDAALSPGFNHSEWAANELKFLQQKPAGTIFKVDKQEIGPVVTKDVADCICIITYKFLNSYLGDMAIGSLKTTRMSFGSEQGFQIGGRNPGGPMGQESRGTAALEQFYGGKTWNSPERTRGIIRGPFSRRSRSTRRR